MDPGKLGRVDVTDRQFVAGVSGRILPRLADSELHQPRLAGSS